MRVGGEARRGLEREREVWKRRGEGTGRGRRWRTGLKARARLGRSERGLEGRTGMRESRGAERRSLSDMVDWGKETE